MTTFLTISAIWSRARRPSSTQSSSRRCGLSPTAGSSTSPSPPAANYLYDTNDNGVLDVGEAAMFYDSSNGTLSTVYPP